jgi:C-terminal processing protease CtpA/Prc
MRKSGWMGWILAPVMVVAAGYALAQQDEGPILRPKKPVAKPAAVSATLLVVCDLACNWRLDGVAQGRIEAGGSAKAKVELGQHLVVAVTEDGLDKVEQVLDIEALKQTLARIDLGTAREARLKVEQAARDKATQDKAAQDKAAQEERDKIALEARDKADREAKEKAPPATGQKVVRGSIGIQFRKGLSGSMDRVYGYKNGILVQAVQPGGPAEKAGLKPLDIVTAIDGRPIEGEDDLVNQIASRKPNTPAVLRYLRDGEEHLAVVIIADRDVVFAGVQNQQSPAQKAGEQAGDKTASAKQENGASTGGPDLQKEQGNSQEFFDKFFGASEGETRLGLVVGEIPPATAAQLHIAGVAIQSVTTGTFADLQGLTSGLLILRVNRQPTGTKAQFDVVAGKFKSGDDVVFEVVDPNRPKDGISYVGGTLP